MSSTKFGGLALFSAGVISAIFFVIQFIAQAPDTSSASNVWEVFVSDNNSLDDWWYGLTTYIQVFTTAIIAYVFVIIVNEFVRTKIESNSIRMGSILFLIGSIGFVASGSVDIAINYTGETPNANQFSLSSLQFGIWMVFTPIAFAGGGLIAHALSKVEGYNNLICLGTAAINAIAALAIVVQVMFIADANHTNTIWGIFIPIVLAFFVSNLFNLYIGYKLTKE